MQVTGQARHHFTFFFSLDHAININKEIFCRLIQSIVLQKVSLISTVDIFLALNDPRVIPRTPPGAANARLYFHSEKTTEG